MTETSFRRNGPTSPLALVVLGPSVDGAVMFHGPILHGGRRAEILDGLDRRRRE